MPRRKRDLRGQQVTPTTLYMRTSIHKKLASLVPPNGTLVETVEQMTEYLYDRRERRKNNQHNPEISPS